MKNEEQASLVMLKSTMSRLPMYYHYLEERHADGAESVSASEIAERLNLKPVLVRKDIELVSSVMGKPRVGFNLEQLLADLRDYLGYDNVNESVLVGVGGLGRTLLSYEGFSDFSLNIVAGFDVNKDLYGIRINDRPVLPMEKLPDIIHRLNIHIGIITVPKTEAQKVCDILVDCGIKAIWNFAPVSLNVSSGVLLKNENLAASLASLSHMLYQKINTENSTE